MRADDIAAKIPMQQITDYLLNVGGYNEPTKIIALHHARVGNSRRSSVA